MLHYFLVPRAAIEKSKSFWFVCFEIGFCSVVQDSPDFWTQGVLQPHPLKIWTTHCSSLWVEACWPPLLCGVLPCSQWSRISQYMFLFLSLCWVLTGLAQCSAPCLLSWELSAIPFLHKMRRSKPAIPRLRVTEFGNSSVFVFLSFFPPLQFSIKSLAVFLSFFLNVNLLLLRFSVCHLILNS